MNSPRYTTLVEGLPSPIPFVSPEAQERVLGTLIHVRIGANESEFGPSQGHQRHAGGGADNWMYGDLENYEPKLALAEHHHIPAKHLDHLQQNLPQVYYWA